LAPNGAGKSTTVGVLTTRVRPTSGQAFIGEHDVWQAQVTVKRLIGVVAQRPNLDFSLTAREILLFHGAYFGFLLTNAASAPKPSSSASSSLIAPIRWSALLRRMMQRLSIARAMMHDPQVLFLDEPSAGLDPQTRLLLWEIVREYNQSGKTILLTTHNMEEADALCKRLAIIDHGRVIALGTPQELKASVPGGYLLRLRLGVHSRTCFSGSRDWLVSAKSAPLMATARSLRRRGGPLVAEVANLAAAAGVELCDVHISSPAWKTFSAPYRKSLRE